MCIVIYKPKGISIKKEIYQNCYNNNKDGAGFIIREKTGEMKLEKGFFTFQDFWENFQPHQSKQAIIHFRIKTHGDIDTENCHPYWVKENSLAFAHNGIISKVETNSNWHMSDTWHFNEKMLKHLQEKIGPDFIFDPVLQSLITEYIGFSKLVFLNEAGKVLIFNKTQGTMEENVWFSNYSFRNWKQTHHTGKKHKTKWEGEFAAQRGSYIPPTAPQVPQHTDLTPTGYKPPVSPIIPIRSIMPGTGVLKANDYIEMIGPWRDLKGNEVGLVISVSGNRTAEIKIYDSKYPTGWKIREIPFDNFQVYSTQEEARRDFEKESALLELKNKVRIQQLGLNNVVEGQVLSKTVEASNSTDMSQVTKLDAGKTLEDVGAESACSPFRETYH